MTVNAIENRGEILNNDNPEEQTPMSKTSEMVLEFESSEKMCKTEEVTLTPTSLPAVRVGEGGASGISFIANENMGCTFLWKRL